MANRVKVIILYNKIFHYRVPVWNLLAEKCDLTVTFSEGNGKIPEGIDCNFKIIPLPAWSFKDRLVIQKKNIRKLVRNYDVVIAYGDIAWLKFSTLPWFNRTKVIYHTLGVSASYTKGYDSNHHWDIIRKFFYSKADALAFYTSHPIEKYAAMGIPREKMFEAPNTVKVEVIDNVKEKNTILFIGTLYREKGLQNLLDAYARLKKKHDMPVLNIVGGGPDYDIIKEWVCDQNLQDNIILHGAIYDPKQKAHFFAQSLACISPLQAGLSVLESMGYGVPFITTRNAITGGEIFNIHDKVDGVLMDSIDQIDEVLEDIYINPDKYCEMGNRAKLYYQNNRTPQNMADGLWKAIQYVLK